ncbi:MAG: prenyltransferase [Candidatus Omnitrophica bacterium]|nr:prenyltransferase [Candidatus Omnitrophota bacterium]
MEQKIKYAIKAARANFLPASLMPFLIGAFYAFRLGHNVSPARFILAFLGVGSMHLAGNLFNDYFDYKSGADNMSGKESPFFGGSRVIQKGLLNSSDVLSLSLFFTALAFLCGMGIYIITEDPVFPLFMLIAAILAFEYTAPPLRLSYNRLGELDIFLLFGVLLVMGSFYLFTGTFTIGAFLVSLPISFLVGAIIVCNEVPDYHSDVAAGKHNLVYIVGRERGYIIYAFLIILSALTLIVNVLSGNIPHISALIILFYAIGVKVTLILKDRVSGMNDFIHASMLTIALHTIVGAAMILTLLVKL